MTDVATPGESAPARSPPSSLASEYRFPGGAHDEMCAAPGEVRPHWQYLAAALGDLGLSELQHRRVEAVRQIRNNDVTFNIYDDPRGMGRPWALDLVPLLVGSEEWSVLEAGLMQRAELLNLVLRDLYDSRRLVLKGVLPPELVYGHPGFLRPVTGISAPGEHSLVFYAAELGRAADGRMCVLADHSQAPTGAGYALENRMVISRVLPSLFRDAHVHRLTTFFRTFRNALNRISPVAGDEPNIVLLTAGPANESYFEHAYLANYLGCALVEGGDLEIRDGQVWLTSLDGRRQVDVILRRMNDSFCDPVELREDSFLGVPGLVHAVRAGRVAIANPLGSGLLDNPGLMKYLPALCRHLLGEDLRLSSVETWWCGDDADLSHVLGNLSRLVIRPIHTGPDAGPVFGEGLDRAGLDDLARRIRARPHQFVAQEPVSMSTAPVLADNGLEPYHAVLRGFLVADEHGYLVMPGGLARVSTDTRALMAPSQAGGVSKDTWVLATEPERPGGVFEGIHRPGPVYGAEAELPPRVADNLFWLGRYAERAEFASRLIRLTLQQLVSGENGDTGGVERLLVAVTRQTATYPGFVGDAAGGAAVRPEGELLSVISDAARVGSLAQTVSSMLRAARSVRDRLSGETWRVVNDIEDELRLLQRVNADRPLDAWDEMDNLVRAMTAMSGVMMENMTRGRGWLFLDLGRRIERAVQTALLLRSLLVPVADEDEQVTCMEAILSTIDSQISYRRRFGGGLAVTDLLALVIQDERNPRAVTYQVAQIEEHVDRLPENQSREACADLRRLALEAATMVRVADVRRMAGIGQESGRREALDQFLGALVERLPAISDLVSELYFRTPGIPHQLLRSRSTGDA